MTSEFNRLVYVSALGGTVQIRRTTDSCQHWGNEKSRIINETI